MTNNPVPLWKMILKHIWARLTGDDKTGIHFLKCDKKGCVYIEFYSALSEELVGRPCRICGSNLLTRDDWDQFESEEKS